MCSDWSILTIRLVNDIAGCQESLLALDSDGDEVDKAVVADETRESLVKVLVLLGEVVLGEGLHQILQVQHICVVIQVELELAILLNKINLKSRKTFQSGLIKVPIIALIIFYNQS